LYTLYLYKVNKSKEKKKEIARREKEKKEAEDKGLKEPVYENEIESEDSTWG
jgi:hypothetical protein